MKKDKGLISLFPEEIEVLDLRKHQEIFDSLDASEATIEDYKARIKHLLMYLQNETLDIDLLRRYKKFLVADVSLGLSSKMKYLAVAKIYFKELYRKSLIPFSLHDSVKQFKQLKKHKKFGLTKEEALRFFNAVDKRSYIDQIIFYLAGIQGLRQVEIIRIKIENIDLVKKTMYIQGKGELDLELIDLHPKTVRVIKQYLESYELKSGNLVNMSSRRLRSKFREIADALEIKASMHGLRHFFVTELIKAFDGDLLEVCKYSRHNSLDSLIIYNDNVVKEKTLPKYYKTFEL